jgi:3-methyl-2-oxobutanoate hydroxymethyltransferase
MAEIKRLTIPDLYAMRERGEKITFLTAYDYPMALLEDRAGVDLILVGDSVAMTVLGYDTTLPMTMDEMILFTKAVRRAAKRAFVIGDLPYMSYQASNEEAVHNAGRFMAECGTDAVKLEGGRRMAERVEAIVRAGIPVMGHIGLTPQSYTQLGGYRAQGRDAATAKALIDDALALQEAGAFAILLECIPAKVAEIIYDRLEILVLSLGSGPKADGQMMIVHDMLGLFEKFTPKFVKRYVNLSEQILGAFKSFVEDVREGRFPQPEHLYNIPEEELEKLQRMLKAHA